MKTAYSCKPLRFLFALLVLFNAVLPIACQTRQDAIQNDGGARSAAQPVWNGVPGEFKATVLGILRPGEPFVVAAAGAGIPQGSVRMQASLVMSDKQLNRGTFFDLGVTSRRGPVKAAIMAVPSTADAGNAILRIEGGGKVLQTLELTIEFRGFKTETIHITSTMTDILTTPDPEKTKQAEQMWAIWVRTGNEVYTLGNFEMPVVSTFQTSIFGTRRIYVYPNGRSSPSLHTGVDWRAPTGTPITAPAAGKVVLAMNRITTGNTVVVEHMPGVYSLYYHMDRLAVQQGDTVITGTRLGDAGATGFATGAHLHYEIRVAAENTDPAIFMTRKILDKEAILAILNE
ncbi:MAG: M23 family metallopeptidase [Treponema sp.]|nr:M23 family metallopeptidase [Treponema sp.]